MAKKPKKHQKTASEALADLKEGNLRFYKENFNDPKHDDAHRNAKRRKELVGGQLPWAVVLSCADSRVPPELIFDCGLGEIFTIRVAGNIANTESIGSIEYAVDKKLGGIGTNLVVVLGHEGCGAVDAAIKSAAGAKPLNLGRHLNGLLSYITPAVHRLSPTQIREFDNSSLSKSEKKKTLNKAIKLNAQNSVAELKSMSPFLNKRGFKIVPAVYSLSTGKVKFFDK